MPQYPKKRNRSLTLDPELISLGHCGGGGVADMFKMRQRNGVQNSKIRNYLCPTVLTIPASVTSVPQSKNDIQKNRTKSKPKDESCTVNVSNVSPCAVPAARQHDDNSLQHTRKPHARPARIITSDSSFLEKKRGSSSVLTGTVISRKKGNAIDAAVDLTTHSTARQSSSTTVKTCILIGRTFKARASVKSSQRHCPLPVNFYSSPSRNGNLQVSSPGLVSHTGLKTIK